jgi:hypothetical protein
LSASDILSARADLKPRTIVHCVPPMQHMAVNITLREVVRNPAF